MARLYLSSSAVLITVLAVSLFNRPTAALTSATVDQVVDQNWVTFNRDSVTVRFGDSGAPTFFKGRVVAIASDGAADCASADVRARVDSKEVRTWTRSQIDLRFPF